MKNFLLLCVLMLAIYNVSAQTTYPVNGSYDKRPGLYASTNANIVINAEQTLTNAVLLVKDQKIEAVGPGIKVPAGYVTVDIQGRNISLDNLHKQLYKKYSEKYNLKETPDRTIPVAGSR